jgi:hypothetical protein
VQRFELALQIPPARGDGFKFGDFSMINVVGHRRFFGIHGRFYSFSVQTCEYIRRAMNKPYCFTSITAAVL